MIRSSRALALALICAVPCGFFPALAHAGPPVAEPTVLSVATGAVEGSVAVQGLRAAGDEIGRRSGGAVVLRVLPGGLSGDDAAVVGRLEDNTLDAAVVGAEALALLAPDALVLGAPGLIGDLKQLDQLRGKLTARLDAALAKKGVVALTWGDTGHQYFLSMGPIRTPSDLRSTKPWTLGADLVMDALIRRAGAEPIALATKDVVQNLTTGGVQTVYSAPFDAIARGWFSHLRYLTNLKLGIGLTATVVRSAAWERLTDDQREVVRQTLGVWQTSLTQSSRTANALAVKTLKSRGVEVVEPEMAAWSTLFGAVQDELAGKTYSKDVLSDVRKLLQSAR